MKKKFPVLCWLLVTLLWLGVIFGFSSQSGEASGGLSAIISQPITDFLSELRGGMSKAEEENLYLLIDGAVRTLAHFSEYAILGACLTLLFHGIGWNTLWLPAICGVIFSVTDEWYQSFAPDRVTDPADVVIDTLGVILGVVLINLIYHYRRKKHVHHS